MTRALQTAIPRRGIVSSVALAVLAMWLAYPGPAPGAALLRRVFVTSGWGPGQLELWQYADNGLTGVAAGDSVCRSLASAAGFPEPQNFRAWLSDTTTDAYCHVRGQTGKKGSCQGADPLPVGPLHLANGITPWAGTLDEIVGLRPPIYRPVLLEQDLDAVIEHDAYWTGTSADGTLKASSATCSNWTSQSALSVATVGDPIGTTRDWTDSGSAACNQLKRLLCIEAGEALEVARVWVPGSLVFVTSTQGPGTLSTWADAAGASGVAAGDAICRAHAQRAGLPDPDSFVAWLSTSTSDAKDRLEPNRIYRRLDGVPIDTELGGILDGATNNPIHVDELGRYPTLPIRAWTGTLASGDRAEQTCEDWTSSEIPPSGRYGGATFARDGWWTSAGFLNCATANALYCFSNTEILFWSGFETNGQTPAL